jgi:S1-C subfamily serine protease
VRTCLTCLAVAVAFAAVPRESRADDAPKKKGFIGVQIKKEEDGPVTIVSVMSDSPAEKAGLKDGDVLVTVGDVEASDLQTVVDTIRKLKPKDKVKIRVKREGKEKDIEVTVGEAPAPDKD